MTHENAKLAPVPAYELATFEGLVVGAAEAYDAQADWSDDSVDIVAPNGGTIRRFVSEEELDDEAREANTDLVVYTTNHAEAILEQNS